MKKYAQVNPERKESDNKDVSRSYGGNADEGRELLQGRISFFQKERENSRRQLFHSVVSYGITFGAFGFAIYVLDFYCLMFISSYPRILSIFIGGFSILIIDLAILTISTVPVDLLDLDFIMESPESKYRWLRIITTIFLLFAVYNQNINRVISLCWWGMEIVVALMILYENNKFKWNHFSYKISLFFLLMPFGLSIEFGTYYYLENDGSCFYHCVLMSNLLAGYFLISGIILVYTWVGIWKQIQANNGNAERTKPTVLVYVAGYGLLIICGPFHFIHAVIFFFINMGDDVLGTKEILIGLSFIIPPLVVISLTRDWLFNFMSRRFDRDAKNLKKDGAFIAGLLATQDITINEIWYVHRGRKKVNYKYDSKNPLRFFRKGTVVAINSITFQVALREEVIEYETSQGERVIETLPADNVHIHNGQVIDADAVAALTTSKSNQDEEQETANAQQLSINMHSDELLKWAHENLRCIEWENMSESLFMRRSIRTTDESSTAVNYYTLSRALKPGETTIDFFVSHAWADDGHLKYKALCSISEDFFHLHHRRPTFWFDKVCFDQNNLNAGLKVLPINIMSCDKVLVLCGPHYASRLWCIWELFTLFAFVSDEKEAISKVELVSIGAAPMEEAPSPPRPPTASNGHRLGPSLLSPPPPPPGEEKSAVCASPAKDASYDEHVLAKLQNYRLEDSTCYDPNERKKLLRVIQAVGVDIFESRIRKLATSCKDKKAAHKPVDRRASGHWALLPHVTNIAHPVVVPISYRPPSF